MVGWESISKVIDLDFVKAGIGQRVLRDDEELALKLARGGAEQSGLQASAVSSKL